MSPITRRRAKATGPTLSRLAAKQEAKQRRRNRRQPSPTNSEEESQGSEIDESGSDNEFEVENILDKKIKDGVVYYRIKWRGFDMRYVTWEPVDNLQNAPGKIEMFEKSRALEEAQGEEEKLSEVSKEKKGGLLGKRERVNTRSTRRTRYLDEEGKEDEEVKERETGEKRVMRGSNRGAKTRGRGESGKSKETMEEEVVKGEKEGKGRQTRSKKTVSYVESEGEDDSEKEEEKKEEEKEEKEEKETKGDEEAKMVQEEAVKPDELEKEKEKEKVKEVTNENEKPVTVLINAPPLSEEPVQKTLVINDETKPNLSVLSQEKIKSPDSLKLSINGSTNVTPRNSTFQPGNSAFQTSKALAIPKETSPRGDQPVKPLSSGLPNNFPPSLTPDLYAQYMLANPLMNPLLANGLNPLANPSLADDMALKNFITFQGSLQISNYLFPPGDLASLNAGRFPGLLPPNPFQQAPNFLMPGNQNLLNSLALQNSLSGTGLFPGSFPNNFNLPLNYPMNPLLGFPPLGGMGLGGPSADLLAKSGLFPNAPALEGQQLGQILGMNMNHRMNLMNLQQSIHSGEKKGNGDGKKDGLGQTSLSRQQSANGGNGEQKKNQVITPIILEKDKEMDIGASSKGQPGVSDVPSKQ